MASSDGHRSGLLTAAGILSIVGGVFLLTGGVFVTLMLLDFTYHTNFSAYIPYGMFEFFLLPFFYNVAAAFARYFDVGSPLLTVIMAGLGGAIGIIALVGGISSIRRRNFGLSLAGAICALPSVPSGILAVIFVSLGKREFGVKGS